MPNWNWNSVVNAVPQHGTCDGRADRQSGRPNGLDDSKAALAQRMHASGESATTIAATLKHVSRSTVHRALAEQGETVGPSGKAGPDRLKGFHRRDVCGLRLNLQVS